MSTNPQPSSSSAPPPDRPLEQARANVQTTLTSVQQSMAQMAERTTDLDSIGAKTEQFASSAATFARSSRQLQLKLKLKQYLVTVYISLLAADILAYVFFKGPGDYWLATVVLIALAAVAHFAAKAYDR